MAQEIRNYRFTYQSSIPDGFGEWIPSGVDEHEVICAYDLNEAMIQFQVKFGNIPVIEIIPFKYIEEQKPVAEHKKEVHVKPDLRTKPSTSDGAIVT